MDLVLVPVHLGMHWCLAVSVFLVIQGFLLFLVSPSSASFVPMTTLSPASQF